MVKKVTLDKLDRKRKFNFCYSFQNLNVSEIGIINLIFVHSYQWYEVNCTG